MELLCCMRRSKVADSGTQASDTGSDANITTNNMENNEAERRVPVLDTFRAWWLEHCPRCMLQCQNNMMEDGEQGCVAPGNENEEENTPDENEVSIGVDSIRDRIPLEIIYEENEDESLSDIVDERDEQNVDDRTDSIRDGIPFDINRETDADESRSDDERKENAVDVIKIYDRIQSDDGEVWSDIDLDDDDGSKEKDDDNVVGVTIRRHFPIDVTGEMENEYDCVNEGGDSGDDGEDNVEKEEDVNVDLDEEDDDDHLEYLPPQLIIRPSIRQRQLARQSLVTVRQRRFHSL